MQESHQIANIVDLKRIHDARASQMGPTVPAALGAKDVFQEQGSEHQRLSEFQLESGNYELRPGSEFYELTDKTHLRGILNHFHPFGRRISWPTLAFSALVGSILPLFAILLVQPLMAERFDSLGKQTIWLLTITLISALYALAGLIIGKTSDWAPFHWIMLISYILAQAMAGVLAGSLTARRCSSALFWRCKPSAVESSSSSRSPGRSLRLATATSPTSPECAG